MNYVQLISKQTKIVDYHASYIMCTPFSEGKHNVTTKSSPQYGKSEIISW